MSVDSIPSLRALEVPLHDSIRELRLGYQTVWECLEHTLAEFDSRGEELVECRRQLSEARRRLSECEQHCDRRASAEAEALDRVSALTQQLEAARQELRDTRDAASQSRSECLQVNARLQTQIEQNGLLGVEVDRWKTEVTAARAEIGQMQTQFAPLAGAAAETTTLRIQLGAAQAELTEVRAKLAEGGGSNTLNEQLAAENSRRQAAEEELDRLRHRAAELAETLGEQKQVLAEERQRWSEELRQLRKALERQTEAISLRPAPSTTNPQQSTTDSQAAAAATPRPQASKAEGSVVASVLEQFEMLQKSKVRKLASTA